MVESIVPMVHGERRQWRQAAALHVAGAAAAGSMVGVFAGLAGVVLAAAGIGHAWRWAAVAALAVAGAAREAFLPSARLPGWRRQVPRSWSEHLSPRAVSLAYGVGLGTGFLTHVTSAAYWLAVAAGAASASPVGGALIGAAFGAVRGGAVVLTTRRLRDWAEARRAVAWMDAHRRLPRHVAATALLALAVASSAVI